ncbi:MAG: S1 RNA-binding domain-containing protein [Myxococcaceae bacterium]|nr:S1 RNA-binding domain-containing protein [Myxococcaceae bacterium]
MLGIPSRREGERSAEGRREEKSGSPAEGQVPERTARPPEKRTRGPLVIVKRAGPPPATVTTEGAGTGAPEAAPAPRPPDDSLFREVPEDETFSEMFEESEKEKKGSAAARRMPRVGEKIVGKIFQLGADTAFVSIGGRSEAMIDLNELKDEEGILRFGVGDEIEAHVIQAGAKGIILSRMLSKGSATLALLQEARASGMPVEGMVLAAKKAGLEVAIGDIRAFCPVSQIDIRFVEKPEQFVGEKLQFRVMEAEGQNIVLSRRAVLEQEQRRKAAETRKSLEVGKVLRGKVTSVRDFGAFVDLGGVEGMIPVSEISHVRIGHPSEVLKVGDEVEVEVIRLEPAQPNSPDKSKHKERITLSMRSRQEDPFQVAARELAPGQRVHGKVVRLQPFGAFVELRPGVDGLIHISAMSERRIAHPRDVVKVGDEVEVQIEKIDPNEKRIGLRLVKDGQVMGEDSREPVEAEKGEGQPAAERAPRPKVGLVVTAKVDRVEPYGVFVRWPGGKGLIRASETGTQRGTDLKKHFPIDAEVKAAIVEIDPSGKINLSITEAEKAEERAAVTEWTKSQKGGGGKGFGTLGDLLRQKLSK